jgi:hypothetical protein
LQRRAVNGANNRPQMGDFEHRFIGSHGVEQPSCQPPLKPRSEAPPRGGCR